MQRLRPDIGSGTSPQPTLTEAVDGSHFSPAGVAHILSVIGNKILQHVHK